MSTAPTMRQLKSWHRRLATAHEKAVTVSHEARAYWPDHHNDLVIISDPIVELHAALGCIEGLIEERAALRRQRRQPAKDPAP